MRHIIRGALGALCLGLLAAPVQAQDKPSQEKLKIGFVSTLSGPTALTGDELLAGFKLGLAHVNNHLGGRDVDLILGDDQAKTEIGRQLVQKMIEEDHADLLTGIVLSNVMMAVAKTFEEGKTHFISINAGPSPLAGKQCSPWFFAASYQVDQPAEAMGAWLQKQGVKNLYLIGANYQAGRDMMTGLKRNYHGTLAGEVYTTFNQMDYAAELATVRAANPGGLFYFITSVAGINFLKQYAQSGLKATVPLYATGFSVDQSVLPSVGDTADGVVDASFWSETLDNPANREFVAAYEAKYNRIPSLFAADAYDAVQLIDAALRITGGRTDDKQALGHALETAQFPSVRGKFRFNTNHFPIQDFYLLKVGTNAKGQRVNNVIDVAAKDAQDSYVGECPMK